MAWKPGVNAPLGLPVPGNVDDSALVAVGTVAKFYDDTQGEGVFIYLPGVASTAAGDAVSYDLAPGGQATVRLTNAVGTNKGWPIAIASAAIVAAKYGWYQIEGVAIVNVAAGFAAGSAVFATGTAGVLDDGADAGDQILGARGSSAVGTPSANKAYITLNRPHTQGQIT